MGGVSHSHPTTPFKLAGALGHVALDLLQERDALKDKLAESEAKVKELTLHLSIAVGKMESFQETGGVWNCEDEPDLAAMKAVLKGAKHGE